MLVGWSDKKEAGGEGGERLEGRLAPPVEDEACAEDVLAHTMVAQLGGKLQRREARERGVGGDARADEVRRRLLGLERDVTAHPLPRRRWRVGRQVRGGAFRGGDARIQRVAARLVELRGAADEEVEHLWPAVGDGRVQREEACRQGRDSSLAPPQQAAAVKAQARREARP